MKKPETNNFLLLAQHPEIQPIEQEDSPYSFESPTRVLIAKGSRGVTVLEEDGGDHLDYEMSEGVGDLEDIFHDVPEGFWICECAQEEEWVDGNVSSVLVVRSVTKASLQDLKPFYESVAGMV